MQSLSSSAAETSSASAAVTAPSSMTASSSSSPGFYQVATLSIVVVGITSCAAASSSSVAMGNTFTIATGVPASWLASTNVQCGPSLAAALRRRELQASPTPAVGSTVIFTYVMSIPLNAPVAQIALAQNVIVTTTTASFASLTTLLVTGVFPQSSVVGVYGSVNGVACGSSAGMPSCASLFSPTPLPAPPAAPTSIGAIVGGVIGALVVIVAIALTIFLCRRARARAAEAADLQAAAAAAQADPAQFAQANPMPLTPAIARSLSTRTVRSLGAITAPDNKLSSPASPLRADLAAYRS